ncbi:MAG: helix-turn-helix domain-containing protein [Prevotellaceae bacterium]|jgi:hypothetical protein|nr:helix-turn-helix domain-containing protein [Prevotellaceae bacterium]
MDNSSLFAIARDYVEQTSQHVFLTGKAGTGKTTFLRHIVQTTHKHAVVAAPTGVAAINAGGVTLHSLFQLSFAPYVPDAQYEHSRFSQVKLDVLRRMELLIIDEVSMLRSDTLDAIDAVLKRVRRNSRAFGGVQVLYIGDMFQLPPVVKDDEWAILKQYYQTQFFFHSHILQQNPLVYIELKQVYRQQDSNFVDLLNRVRNNILQPSDFELLNSRFVPNFTPPANKKYITLTTHNYQADRINLEKLNKIQSQAFEFQGVIKDDFSESMLPVEITLQLKLGAQIMFVKNDSAPEKLYYNGKIGTITKISYDEICVLCEGDDTEIQLHTETWENNRYTLNKESGEMEEEVLGTFTQYPVRLAWAITIHKSQGLTFNNVILDISRAFAAGQAYVALSRCTSLQGIVFQSLISPSAIQTDKYALTLSAKERSQTELENTLKIQKQIFWTEKLKNYFDLKPLFSIFYEFDKLLKEKIGEEFDDAKTLLENMRKFAHDQEDTIKKFQNQLQNICRQTAQSADLFADTDFKPDNLQERCQKAVEFFYPLYIDNLLLPMRENIQNFYGVKKSKAYYKNLLNIEQDLMLFIEDLKKIRYYDKPFINGELLKIPQNKVETEIEKKIEEISKEPKRQKGDSAKLSFEMYQKGKPIAEIAAERKVTESTIFGHLSICISSGQISVYELVSREKVEQILPLIDAETKSTSVIKNQLGDDISYDEIRAVMRHYNWEKKNKKSL